MAEMQPGDVPAEYVEAGADRIHAHYAANPDDESEENAIRILLAAVLPMHEQQVRERVLAEVGEYRIEADSDYSGERWMYVVHKTCQSQVYDTRHSGAELEDELDGAELTEAIEAHRCGEGDGRG